jgi:hypothetical protein
MSKQLSNPICPNCRYDLTGLIEEGASANCPECNIISTFESASLRLSRSKSIRRAVVLLFVVPIIVATWSFLFFQIWDYEEDGIFTIGFIPLVSVINLVPITLIVFLVKELKIRRKIPNANIYPTIWISLAWIILPAITSILLCFYVIIKWAEAIAGY